jgi:hypothetical protein
MRTEAAAVGVGVGDELRNAPAACIACSCVAYLLHVSGLLQVVAFCNVAVMSLMMLG